MLNNRPVGGIEPLRFSSSTGLKPALRTTEGQLGILLWQINLFMNCAKFDRFCLWLHNVRLNIIYNNLAIKNNEEFK